MINEKEIREWYTQVVSIPDQIPGAGGRLVEACLLIPDVCTKGANEDLFPGVGKYDEDKAGSLFKNAGEGDTAAQYALRVIAMMLLLSGRILPPKLASFAAKALETEKLTRRGRPPNYLHNLAIVHLVERVCKERGIFATRNEATLADTGCNVVASALALKESAVEEAWGKRNNAQNRKASFRLIHPI